MKKSLTVLFFLITYNVVLKAQERPISRFLFEDYQETLILYKDGRQFTAPVNFDLLNGHYLFIDSKDKEPKQFSNPELIALLRIGTRSFLLGEKETTEVLQGDPLFQVTYSGNLRQAPKKITYGGTTQTAAVDTYAGYSGGGSIGTRQQSNNKVVVGVNKNYKAKFGKKTKRFNNKKTFLKAVPKEMQAEMERYIETEQTDFNDVKQVLELYKYTMERITNKKTKK